VKLDLRVEKRAEEESRKRKTWRELILHHLERCRVRVHHKTQIRDQLSIAERN
jgi:hypothetical protein